MKCKQLAKRCTAFALVATMVCSLQAPAQAQDGIAVGKAASNAAMTDWAVNDSNVVQVTGDAESGYAITVDKTQAGSGSVMYMAPVNLEEQAIRFTYTPSDGDWTYIDFRTAGGDVPDVKTEHETIENWGGQHDGFSKMTLRFDRTGADLKICYWYSWEDVSRTIGTIEGFDWTKEHIMGFEKWGDNWYLKIDDTLLNHPSDEAKTLVTANLNTYQQNGGAYIRIGARVNGGQRTLFETVNIIKNPNAPAENWAVNDSSTVRVTGDAESGYAITVDKTQAGSGSVMYMTPVNLEEQAIRFTYTPSDGDWTYIDFRTAGGNVPDVKTEHETIESWGGQHDGFSKMTLRFDRTGADLKICYWYSWEDVSRTIGTIEGFDWTKEHIMGFEKWGDNWYLRIDDTILSNPSDEAKTLVTANLNTYQQNGGAYIRIGARVNGGQRTLFDTVNIIKKLNDQTGWTLGGDAALVGNAETGWQFYLGGQFQRSYYEAKIEASKLQMHFNLSDLAVGETVRVQLSDQAYGYGDFGIEKETAVCFSFERRAEGLHAYILRNGNEVYSKELTDFNFAENHVLEFVRKGNNWVPVLDGDEWEVNEIYDTFIEAMSINSADRTIVDFFSYTNRSIKNLKFTKKLSKNITVTVTAKDITDGSEVADADLQGGGNYVEGKVTVTAPTKSVTGYEFLGWYTGDDLNNFLSRKEIYTFEAKEDVNLVALYRMNSADSKKIVVIDKDTRKEQTYQVGEKITLSALSPDGGFQYWTNQFGLIVSRETVYTFKAVANDILTAHYEQDALKAMVVWESSYGQVMQRGVYDIYDTITEPSVPSILGYENGRWDKTAAEIKEAIRDGKLLITVKAVDYTSKAITYSITVSGGTFDGTEDKTRNYNVNDIVTVTADTAAVGQKFSHWIGYATIEGREAAKTISYESVYKFYAIQDYTVEGVFVSADETVEKQISAEIVQVKKDADNHTMSFVTMLTVPKDYKIVYGGILATTDSSKIDEATGKLNPATADYVRGSRKDDVKILRFTWNKSNVTDAQLWYVCPYLVYEDANGEVHEFIGVLGSYRLTNIGQAQDVE